MIQIIYMNKTNFDLDQGLENGIRVLEFEFMSTWIWGASKVHVHWVCDSSIENV
jgi:hypothetical protein